MKKYNFSTSKKLFKKALKYIPGGVNSPVRAFKAVGGSPLFITRAKGSKIFDADNNAYIDYVMSWGALILGHSNEIVLKEVSREIKKGTSFGAPTEKEMILAEIIRKAIPSMEKVRLVNSGTEATASAIRLARGYTGRDKIVKFEGCYHGCVDSLLVSAGSGAATFSIPASKGIPLDLAKQTLVCPYNDTEKLSAILNKHHKEIACCIVEPVCGNMGVVVPDKQFLKTLRKLTAKYGILLIFDEVITGFRFCFGGVQKIFGIKPDITCLGKIIGGGFPLAAYGGRKEIMDKISPLGEVYQAGTLSGNPVAVTAGIATLKILAEKDYASLNKLAENYCKRLKENLKKFSLPFYLNHFGSMFTLFFTDVKVKDFVSAKTSNTKLYADYFWKMIKSGINLPPSQFEANFISFAHTEDDLNKTLRAQIKILKELK